jgi:hypothetical protein
MFKLISVETRMATDADDHLDTYDHTKLSNINDCPTWGIIRYSHHKRMPGSARSMPLEAGHAAHEGFAAIRLYNYRRQQCNTDLLVDNADMHGVRLFGKARYEGMLEVIRANASDRTNCLNFAIEALERGEFYDDISDNKRTISNISEALIAYSDAYDAERYPIWVRDPLNPNTDIGIEIAFDIVLDIAYKDSPIPGELKELSCRFTGKLDGLHINTQDVGTLVVVDDKTAAKIDDHWLTQWILSHQLTGYSVAGSTFTGLSCNQAQAWGVKLPIGKVAAEGIRKEVVTRNPMLYEKWANWFVTTVEMERRWRDHPLDAPMYTGTCYSYFRSCSFLPFCAATNREEKELILSEMTVDEWSPLHE